jgi:hypothetical protein
MFLIRKLMLAVIAGGILNGAYIASEDFKTEDLFATIEGNSQANGVLIANNSATTTSVTEAEIDRIISEALLKNKTNNFNEGLSLLRQAVEKSNFEAAKPRYFLAKQYVLMVDNNSAQQTEKESFMKMAQEHLEAAGKMGAHAKWTQNPQWAKHAREMQVNVGDGSGGIVLGGQDYNILALISVLEETACSDGRLDVVQTVFNRMNDNQWPSTVTGVAFQSGQFEPFFHTTPANVNNEGKAANFLSRQRGMTYTEALRAIQQVKTDMKNENKMRQARDFVGGRAYFKGVSQYRYRLASDPRRRHGCNFYHTERGETSATLQRRVQKAPLRVTGSN